MDAPSFFSLRRLSPFRGTIQVVELGDGRAFSLDGAGWTIQLLSQNPIRETVWGNIGPAHSERRYFTYARWTRADRLARVPIDPSLGDQSRHPALGPLLGTLENLPGLPFPPADQLELWLLDKHERLPLALVQSATGTEPPLTRVSPGWRALPAEESDFHSPRLMEQAPGDKAAQDCRRHRVLLEKLIGRTAGQPTRLQWFLRDAAGGGESRGGMRLKSADQRNALQADAFPELLVREAWSQEQDRVLVGDYLGWQAPLLLMLPHLRQETRARLEHAATRRATVLYQHRKLIPAIVDKAVVQPALVEAVLRRSA